MSESEAAVIPTRKLRSQASWLAGLGLLAAVMVAIYYFWASATPEIETQPSAIAEHAILAKELESVRVRLNDAQKVNALLRENSIALTQRLSLVEDALANTARGLAPAASTLRLDEASYLLSLAQIRLELFSDPDQAQRSMELADALLSEVNDPKLAQVRQTLAIELDALRALPRVDLIGITAKLKALRGAVNELPVQTNESNGQQGRIAAMLDRYLVVRREGENMPTLGRSAWAVREGIKIEFERAQLALERNQSEVFTQALRTALELSEQALLVEDSRSQAFLVGLRALSTTSTEVKVPAIGAALAQLRSASRPYAPGRPTPQTAQNTVDAPVSQGEQSVPINSETAPIDSAANASATEAATVSSDAGAGQPEALMAESPENPQPPASADSVSPPQ